MIENNKQSTNSSVLRPISMAIVGIMTVLITSLWLCQIFTEAGMPKDKLNFMFLAILIPCIFVGFVGLMSISYVLFPKYNNKIEHLLNISLGKIILCIITGAINAILIMILLQIPLIKFIIFALFIIFTSIGLSNICKIIGDKIYSIANETTTPLKSLLTGIIFIEALAILPIIGQILFIAIALIGLGASIIALFIKEKATTEV